MAATVWPRSHQFLFVKRKITRFPDMNCYWVWMPWPPLFGRVRLWPLVFANHRTIATWKFVNCKKQTPNYSNFGPIIKFGFCKVKDLPSRVSYIIYRIVFALCIIRHWVSQSWQDYRKKNWELWRILFYVFFKDDITETCRIFKKSRRNNSSLISWRAYDLRDKNIKFDMTMGRELYQVLMRHTKWIQN